MNDEVVDVFEPIGEALSETDRIVEAPRPQVPKRTIIKFKVSGHFRPYCVPYIY